MKKGREKCFVKIKLKFEDYKHYLEATQPKNKINHLEKKYSNVDNLKEFIKNNKLILKSQERFKSQKT